VENIIFEAAIMSGRTKLCSMGGLEIFSLI